MPHGGVDSLKDIRRRLVYWLRFVGPRRVAAGLTGAVAALLLGVFLFLPSAPAAELSIPVASPGGTPAGTVPGQVGTAVPGKVRVHVTGAVHTPGVYELRSTDRVVDAVRAAGGATSTADLESINLAQTILDTEQIYVPRRGSPAPRRTTAPRLRPKRLAPTTVPPVVGAPGGGGAQTTVPARVNINSATAAQLDSLPGVGPSTARAIIAYRQSKGPFSKPEDLLNVPGIGPAKLDAMRAMIET